MALSLASFIASTIPTVADCPLDTSFLKDAYLRPFSLSDPSFFLPIGARTPARSPLVSSFYAPSVSKPRSSPSLRLVAGAGPSPFRSLVDALSPTTHRDVITHPLCQSLLDPLKDSLSTYPYAVSSSGTELLNSYGISVSGFGSASHPHPIHKTIEINLLTHVWPKYATDLSSVLFMKPEKFEKLQKKNDNFSELLNYRLTPKDTTRYPFSSTSLPKHKTCFMHDALMYFTPAQILGLFAKAPNLEKLYASLVVPPESSFCQKSFYPSFYKFSVTGDQLHYQLEDHPASTYTQPNTALIWLSTTTICCPDLYLSVTILDSWGPVHSILIQKGLLTNHQLNDTVFFKNPECIMLPAATDLEQNERDRLVPKVVYDALFTYVRAVRSLRTTDPAGFVRTQSSKPEYDWVTSAAWDNLHNFALQTAPCKPKIHYGPLKSPWLRFCHWLRINSFSFFSFKCSVLTLLSTYFANKVSHLTHKTLDHFSLFGRFLVSPKPHSFSQLISQKISPPKPSSFSFGLRDTQKTFIHPCFDRFTSSSSWSTASSHWSYLNKFKPITSSKLTIPLMVTAAAIPVSYWWYNAIVGPDTPQAQLDDYQRYFHPSPWQMTIKRSAIYTSPSDFLPFTIAPPPTAFPPSPADVRVIPLEEATLSPAIPASEETSPEILSHPEMPPPTQKVDDLLPREILDKKKEQQKEKEKLEKKSNPTPPPSVLPPTPPTQEEIKTFELIPDPTPQASYPPKPEPSPPAPNLLSLAVRAPLPDIPSTPANPITPPPSHAQVLSGSEPKQVQDPPSFSPVLDPSSGRVDFPIPTVRDENPTPGDLLSDSTAAGPVALYSDLYPGEYLEGSGTFLTRQRNGSPSSAPYPEKNDCLLVAINKATGIQKETLWAALQAQLPDCQLNNKEIQKIGLSTDAFCALARTYSMAATFLTNNMQIHMGMKNPEYSFTIKHTPGPNAHFELTNKPGKPLIAGSNAELNRAITGFRLNNELLPFMRVHRYSSHVPRAKNLISNMKNGFDGVLANANPIKPSDAREQFLALDNLLDLSTSRTVSLVHMAGFAGCGKSYPVQQLLRHPLFRDYKVAVPTTELRSEWKDGLKTRNVDNWRIGTWESSLLKNARILVIDEVYKMPRGYLDLAIHSSPATDFVIVLGDPIQGEYHATHPSSTNYRLSPEYLHLLPYLDVYCMWSRRIPKNIADFFQVPTLNDFPGHPPAHLPSFPSNAILLCNSTSTAKTLVNCGHKATTVSASQGSTYKAQVCILLDKNSSLLSNSNSLVALTRSTMGVCFTGDRHQLGNSSSSNLLFSRFFLGEPVNLLHIFNYIFSKVRIIYSPLHSRRLVLVGGNPEIYRKSLAPLVQMPAESTLKRPSGSGRAPGLTILTHHTASLQSTYQDDVIRKADIVIGDGSTNAPQISTHFLPETRRPLHFDIASDLPSSISVSPADITDSFFEPIYPGETFENLAAHFLPANDPTLREIVWKGSYSNQFPWVNLEFCLSAQTSSLISATHNSKNDPTLLPSSIPRRLSFRASASPYTITAKDELLGTLLYQSLCNAYRRSASIRVPFQPELYAQCINENEFAQLSSKTQQVIMSNIDRSDPSWPYAAVRIFSKTQQKVNEGSIFGSWKACQTLALMHDAVVLILGPVKKYQRIFDRSDRPEHIYVHASNTPFDMSKWCQKHLTKSVHVANDYRSFDQSQHGEAVVLERKKMERLNIPQNLIDLHVHLKTHITTQYGPLTCMRLTGEPGTYDDNTDYNLAVLFSEYLISSAHAVMVSGDDSLLDSLPPPNPIWPVVKPLLSLTFKKEFGRYSIFCGYFVGQEGAIRVPRTLFAKLMIAVDDGSISDKLASYLTEFSVGHSLGQVFWNLIPVDQVQFASACFDFFCRHASREQKLVLKIGSPPLEVLETIFSGISWASNTIFSMLRTPHRKLLMLFNKGRAIHTMDTAHYETRLHEAHRLVGGASHYEPHNSLNCFPFADQHKIIYSLPLSMESVIATILAELASRGLTNGSLGQNQAGNPSINSAASTDSHLVSPPSLPAPPRTIQSKLQSSSSGMKLPFQWNCYDLTGQEKGSTSIDIAAKDIITTLCAPFRFSQLSELEAVIFCSAPGMSTPLTVDLIWSPQDTTIKDSDIMNTFGGHRVTIGGPLDLGDQTIIKAPLGQLNPIIKDSITYHDTPRLCISFHQDAASVKEGSSPTIKGSIIIRGTLSVSSPGIHTTKK